MTLRQSFRVLCDDTTSVISCTIFYAFCVSSFVKINFLALVIFEVIISHLH